MQMGWALAKLTPYCAAELLIRTPGLAGSGGLSVFSFAVCSSARFLKSPLSLCSHSL
jgi:hypothetical protein